MSNKHELRRQRFQKVINKKSKKQEKKLSTAIQMTQEKIKENFPGLQLEYKNSWKITDIISRMRIHSPNIEFYFYNEKSNIRPDGGIVSIKDIHGICYPILIAEKKNQGTNDLRKKEGKSKQAMGNAIERLGKNVIGFRTALLHEKIFPFVCFGDGSDFADGSSILDRVVTIAMFGKLNTEHLENTPDGLFNRGTFYFREKEWSVEEMATLCYSIAEKSIFYYFSTYKQKFFPQ